MATNKAKNDPGRYGNYSQYAFRASRQEIDDIQVEINTLYKKFNKGRNPKEPKGKKAVKVGDIALEALKIGIATLQKRQKWEFQSEDGN